MPQPPASAIRKNVVVAAPDLSQPENLRNSLREISLDEYVEPDQYTCKHLEDIAVSIDKEEYFGHTTGSIRVEFGETLNKQSFDPIGTMKDGVMVLYFDTESGNFIRRIIKVDDQLRFLYIMEHTTTRQVRDSTINRSIAGSVIAIPLADIGRIFAMDDAMHICDKNGCALDISKLHSVFVIHVDPSAKSDAVAELGDDVPAMDAIGGGRQLYIFLASPEQQLRMCIKRCIDFIEGKYKDPTSIRKRIDQISLQDSDEMLERACPDIRFDISYKNESSLREITLSTDKVEQTELCFHPDMGGIRQKLEKELLPMDFARMHFVLQDAISLRRTLVGLTTDCFRRGITKFLQETSVELPLPESINILDSIGEVEQAIRVLNANSNSSAHCRYFEASTRGAMFAIQHMFALEQSFNMLTMGGDHFNTVVSVDEDDLTEAKKAADALSDAKWRCSNCKFINEASDTKCGVCGTPLEQQRVAPKQRSATRAPGNSQPTASGNTLEAKPQEEMPQCKQQ